MAHRVTENQDAGPGSESSASISCSLADENLVSFLGFVVAQDGSLAGVDQDLVARGQFSRWHDDEQPVGCVSVMLEVGMISSGFSRRNR